jgi:hypothetical protein
MLIGRDLEHQAGTFPRIVQRMLLAERIELIHGISQQEAQPGNILRLRARLQPLNMLRQFGARHRFGNWLIHGR